MQWPLSNAVSSAGGGRRSNTCRTMDFQYRYDRSGVGLGWPLYVVVVLLCLQTLPLRADDWRQFRGNNSAGLGSGSPVATFDADTNVIWSTPFAPGHSSPCLHGDRLFLTTFNEVAQTVSVVCIDKRNGEELWETRLKVDAFEKGHPSFNPASSSPCCDDHTVVAYFGSYGLVCLDHEGGVLWEKRLPLTKSFGGNATSPIVHGDKVILYRGNYVDHYIACFNKQTGEELWRVPQGEEFTGEMACTACPIVHNDKLICHSARCVQAFDLDSGDRLWIVPCATTATSTPIVVGDEVLVAAWNKLGEPDLRPSFPIYAALIEDHDNDNNGTIARNEFPKLWIFHRPAGNEAPMNGAPVSFKHADKNKNGEIEETEWTRTIEELEKFRDGYKTHGLLAIPLDSKGHVSADQVRVLTTRGIPEVPSPVSDGERVYLIKNGGQLSVVEVETAIVEHRMRTKGSGTHYASPLIADGRLYSFAGNGTVTVLSLDDKPSILAVNDLADAVYATPAIVDGVIYLRTHSKLYAFGEAN
ncbi:MAG: PQQ-binding-like beta-propeller repeat protein [Planctomycetota bacterium]